MRRLVLVVMCAALAQQAFGWGSEGHRAINGVAASRIPASMPGFLKKAGARLEYLGPEPDRWRNPEEFAAKNAEDPNHYIDLERLDWMKELPRGRYQYYRALYDRRAAMKGTSADGTRPDDLLPERVGLQPYITMEIFDRLKVAFREYRRMQAAHQKTEPVEQNIVFYMGWLGHYVGDASNPLHTSIHYKGWVGDNPNHYTTEHRIDWTMEGPFVAETLRQMSFAERVKAPEQVGNPWTGYQKYLHDSNTLVERCYQLEKAGGFAGRGSAESRAFIRQRLAAASQMLVNLWYTAWIESGKEPEKPASH